MPVAGVDDADPVAHGIGEDDEVRVVGVQVPVDPLGADRDQPLHLGGLLGGVGRLAAVPQAGLPDGPLFTFLPG